VSRVSISMVSAVAGNLFAIALMSNTPLMSLHPLLVQWAVGSGESKHDLYCLLPSADCQLMNRRARVDLACQKQRRADDGADSADYQSPSQRSRLHRKVDAMGTRWNDDGLQRDIGAVDRRLGAVDAGAPARIRILAQNEKSA